VQKDSINVVIVVPPWTILDTPNLGAHLLQASVQDLNCKVYVFYSDQLLANKIGLKQYKYISEDLLSQYELIQERLFVKAAYPDLPFLGRRVTSNGIDYKTPRSEFDPEINWSSFYCLEKSIDEWVCETAATLASSEFQLIGFTISHQQTNASIALIDKIKELNSKKIIVVGGSNCDGKMANGILSLSNNIDFIFTGKSDISFKNFINDYSKGFLPQQKIIHSKTINNLDDLPTPLYDDYFFQIKENKLELKHWINIESSRGCWWGWKNQCKFCGVNGSHNIYKSKTAERIYKDIVFYNEEYQVRNFRMVDTLMPRKFFKSLIPKLSGLGINIFYEQRADVSFEQMSLLKKAGVNSIQIGIESLCSSHLALINKGVSVANNINSLRYSSILNIYNGWNLLYNIPNEDEIGWKKTLDVLPFIKHLPPPSYFRPVEIARFSPYHEMPELYNIKNLKYFDVYDDIYPHNVDIESLAWLFEGEYPTVKQINPDLIESIGKFVKDWILSWQSKEKRSRLVILEKDGEFILVDTRGLDKTKKIQIIDRDQVSVALIGPESRVFPKYAEWAKDNKLVIDIDGTLVALTITNPILYQNILHEYKFDNYERN
jgi:ribosomal peptide maturation radical SAM protein 1